MRAPIMSGALQTLRALPLMQGRWATHVIRPSHAPTTPLAPGTLRVPRVARVTRSLRAAWVALAVLILPSWVAAQPAPSADAALEVTARAVLDANRKTVVEDGHTWQFTCPDASKYPYQWLWDSCFHAIGLRWSDPARARAELESLLAGQWSSGMVPNIVHIDGEGLSSRVARWMQRTGRNTSGITQPPILAEAVLACHEASPDLAFLGRVFPALVRYYDWLAAARDPDGEGLPFIAHPWESGADDSPRWDPVLGITRFDRAEFNVRKLALLETLSRAGFDARRLGDKAPFLVRGIDMACYTAVNLDAMERIATLLGRADQAAQYRQRARATRRAILARMWNPSLGTFVDLLGPRATPSPVRSPFGLLPLYAGVVDATTAREMARALQDPALFGTSYPVPSIAAGATTFDPRAYWRGTVWTNVNWFLIRGLRRYGMEAEAQDLAARTLDLVRKGGMREYFNPLTGEGYGAAHFSWTAALTLDLLHSSAWTASRDLAHPGAGAR